MIILRKKFFFKNYFGQKKIDKKWFCKKNFNKNEKTLFCNENFVEKFERMCVKCEENGNWEKEIFGWCEEVGRFKKYRRTREIVDRSQWHKIKRRTATENEEKLWRIEA